MQWLGYMQWLAVTAAESETVFEVLSSPFVSCLNKQRDRFKSSVLEWKCPTMAALFIAQIIACSVDHCKKHHVSVPKVHECV